MTFFAPTEDTLPPSHFHEMGPVRTFTDANSVEHRAIEWIPIVDLETAREIVTYELNQAIAAAHPLTRKAAHQAATLAAMVTGARTLDELVSIDISMPHPPSPNDRRLHNPTKVHHL